MSSFGNAVNKRLANFGQKNQDLFGMHLYVDIGATLVVISYQGDLVMSL
jgi:hypothetical protein